MMKLILLSLTIIYNLNGVFTMRIAPTPTFRVEPFTDGIYGASNMDTGDHSMIIITSEGVMVVETFSTSHSTVLLQEIKKLTNMKIKQVVVTHNHWDHASGTKVFRENDAATKIICHEEALPAIVANLGPDQEVPNTVWKGVKETYVWGNMTIEYHYLGLNHGNGMTVIVVPKPKMAFIGDIISPHRLTFAISPDYNQRELERTLKELVDNFDLDRVIYSHNTEPESWKGGTKQDIANFLEYLQDLRIETRKYLFNSSVGFMEVAGLVKMKKYENWTFYNEFLEMNVWRVITDEVMGPYAWRTLYNESTWEGRNHECSGGILEASRNANLVFLLLLLSFLLNFLYRS